MNESQNPKINQEMGFQIALRQNRIRNKIALKRIEKSESIYAYNQEIKVLEEELRQADEEWRTGVVQQEFDLADHPQGANNAKEIQ